MLRDEYKRYLTSLYEQGVVKKIPTTERGWSVHIQRFLVTPLQDLPQYKRTFIEKFVQPLFKRYLLHNHILERYKELNYHDPHHNNPWYFTFPSMCVANYILEAFPWYMDDEEFWNRRNQGWTNILKKEFNPTLSK